MNDSKTGILPVGSQGRAGQHLDAIERDGVLFNHYDKRLTGPSDKIDGRSDRLDLNNLPLFVFNSRVGAKKYGNEQEDQKSS